MNIPDGQDAVETLVRAIPVALKTAIVEIKETAQATAAHVGRWAAFANARWAAQNLERHAFDANVDFGRRLAELGIGDAEQRERIARCQESIRRIQAAGGKTSRAAVKLEAQEVKLAQIELERGTTVPEANTEYVTAVSARDAIEIQHGNVALRRTALRPANRAHALRLGAGYFIVCLLLVVLIVTAAIQIPGGDAIAETTGAPFTIETDGTERSTVTAEHVAAEKSRSAEEDTRVAATESDKSAAENTLTTAEEKQQEDRASYRSAPKSAQNAMNALTRVAARTEVGISYKDYSTAVGEAWAEVKIFAESPDGEEVPEFSYLLLSLHFSRSS